MTITDEKYGKVICRLSNFKEVDILLETPRNMIRLSKALFKECAIKLRLLVPDVTNIGQKDLIIFTNNETNFKETVSPVINKISD